MFLFTNKNNTKNYLYDSIFLPFPVCFSEPKDEAIACYIESRKKTHGMTQIIGLTIAFFSFSYLDRFFNVNVFSECIFEITFVVLILNFSHKIIHRLFFLEKVEFRFPGTPEERAEFRFDFFSAIRVFLSILGIYASLMVTNQNIFQFWLFELIFIFFSFQSGIDGILGLFFSQNSK